MSDSTSSVAFNEGANEAERTEALTELQRSAAPSAMSDLLPSEDVQRVIAHIQDEYELAKATNIVQFPAKEKARGMVSVDLDEWQIAVQGDYYERPSALGFDSLREMVRQTPVLNAVIMTRARQVQRFCRVAEDNNDAPGFEIAHIDRSHELNKDEHQSIQLLSRFIQHCGWEFKPRARKALKRDSFSQLMGKLTRDTLTMDSAAIETEWRRDKNRGIDGLYGVDGATIRLCTERGYEGDDSIFALQVVQGRVCTAYTYQDLIYEARNPQTDVNAAGYGIPETELLVRVVTGFLNAMSYNSKGFDQNAIPKGMLHLTGNYDQRDLDAFKRYWNSMVKGINNAWTLPVMVSKDQESRAAFERFGVEHDEMAFSKWMTFLTSIICAIYGMSPAEINFDSFTAGSTSALAGSDTAEKLAASKDSGLRPLLAYFESLFTDYVLSDFSDRYVFRWTGLDPQDAEKKHELRKMILTVNEARAEEGYEPLEGPMGEAPLNPSLVGPWMQITQGDQEGGQEGEPVGEQEDEPGEEPEDDEQPEEAPEEDPGTTGQQALDDADFEGLSKALDFGVY